MIKYVKGDATQPVANNKKLIVHVCNDIGAWGAGFVLQLSKRWLEPERRYRETPHYKLGDVIYAKCEQDISVANLIGQHGVGRVARDIPPVRYEAIRKGLQKIAKDCNPEEVSIHMPKMGCGLAGGRWSIVQQIIEDELNDFEVTVYELNPVRGSSDMPRHRTYRKS